MKTIDVKSRAARGYRIGALLRGLFQEWVLHLALVGAVFTALIDGVAAVSNGMIV